MIKYVTHIRCPNGEITHLRVNGNIMARDKCIHEIETYKDVIYEAVPSYDETVPNNAAPGARIYVVTAEDGKKYLRIDENVIAADDLGNLLEFESLEGYVNC